MSVTISPYALLDLPTFKALIGTFDPSDTSQDDKLTLFINGASQWIETYCDRYLAQRNPILETRDGNGTGNLLLRQWPVTGVASLYIDSSRTFGPDTLIDPSDYEVTDDGEALDLFDMSFGSGRRSVKIIYQAGYPPGFIPYDLQQATFWLANWMYQFNSRGDIGRSSKSKGDENMLILQDMPPLIANIIQNYKRTEFPDADRPWGSY